MTPTLCPSGAVNAMEDKGVKVLMRVLQAQQRSRGVRDGKDATEAKENYEVLLEMAESALGFDGLTDEDRKAIEDGVRTLKQGFSLLNSTDPNFVRYGAWRIMFGAAAIASRATVAGSVKKSVATEHTQKMRDARTNSPEKKALREAIVAERGDGPVDRPTKEAGAILDRVNARLESAGFPPVKIDVVRRQLEKFPRS